MISAFLWRYEPVQCTGKSDDWLTIFCSHNKVDCWEIPIVLSYFFHWIMAHFNFVISQNAKWGHAGFYIDRHRMTSLLTCAWLVSILACWLLSRPNWRIVSKLTTDVVTYCTEASNQKSKYAYRKIFFYKKALVVMMCALCFSLVLMSLRRVVVIEITNSGVLRTF